MLQVNRVSQITVLRSQALERISGVVHAFSTRRAEHGSFTLGPFGSDNPAIRINRDRFLAAAGMAGWPLVKVHQVHSGIVHSIRSTWSANENLEGDALVTGVTGIVLAVQTADCVPVLMADLNGHAIAAVHAGWRGLAAGVAARAVEALERDHGVPPSDVVAVIGPHNAVCCYEVGDDVVAAVGDPEAFVRKPGWIKPHLDQGIANQRQLSRAGVPESQIYVSSLCTQCRPDLLFSYRREGKQAGRLLSVIGMQP